MGGGSSQNRPKKRVSRVIFSTTHGLKGGAPAAPLFSISRLDLRFPSPSREIAARHSPRGGAIGKRLDPGKNARHWPQDQPFLPNPRFHQAKPIGPLEGCPFGAVRARRQWRRAR